MDLYLDDCSDADRLVLTLQSAGHRVETPRSAKMIGRSDPDHLAYAAQHQLTLLTRNPADFLELHHDWQAQGRSHGGILLIYLDNIKGKDMGPHDVVRAISKLVASGLPIGNEIHTLNQWR
jgi:hypothetical protein